VLGYQPPTGNLFIATIVSNNTHLSSVSLRFTIRGFYCVAKFFGWEAPEGCIPIVSVAKRYAFLKERNVLKEKNKLSSDKLSFLA